MSKTRKDKIIRGLEIAIEVLGFLIVFAPILRAAANKNKKR